MKEMQPTIEKMVILVRNSVGSSLVLIGLDKVFRTYLFVYWDQYVSPLALSVLPFNATTIVITLGLAEIILGILFFTHYAKWAAYIALGTILIIIINLLSLYLYDIALRDALIGVLLLVFIRLYEISYKSVK